MISETAVEDIEALEAEGVRLSPSEVVRLNALGLKLERGENSASLYTLPRCAFLGDLTFFEPTIGHELWLDNVARKFDLHDSLTGFALRAFALATRDASSLPDWSDAHSVIDALKIFVERELSRHTMRAVVNCVNYCLNGSNASTGEYHTSNEDGETRVPDDFSAAVGVVREGLSLALGISIGDAKRLTRSEHIAIIARAYEAKGIDVTKSAHANAVGDYFAELDKIKEAHAKEVVNG